MRLLVILMVSVAIAQFEEPAVAVAEAFPREARSRAEVTRKPVVSQVFGPSAALFQTSRRTLQMLDSLLPRATRESARVGQRNLKQFFMCMSNKHNTMTFLDQRRYCGRLITGGDNRKLFKCHNEASCVELRDLMQRQAQRANKNIYKCRGTLRCEQTQDWMQRKLENLFDVVMARASEISNDETRNLMMRFAQGRPVVAREPSPGFYGATAMFGVVFIASLILFVSSILRGLWRTEKRLLLPFLGVLVCAALLRTISWSWVAAGYQKVGFDPDVIAVPEIAVRILEGIGSVLFMALFAFFCWFLMDALLDSFVDQSEKKSLILKIGFIIVTGTPFVYGLTMFIIASLPTTVFYFDMSYALSAGITFFYSVILEASWIYAYRHVDNAEMKQNALIFAFGTGIMVVSFAAWFALSIYWTAVDSSILMAVWALELVSQLLISWGVILYIGVTVNGMKLNPTQEMMRNKSKGGYVPLKEDPNEIPAQYADF